MVWFKAEPNVLIRRIAGDFAASIGLLPGDSGSGGSLGVAGGKGAIGLSGPAGSTGAAGPAGATGATGAAGSITELIETLTIASDAYAESHANMSMIGNHLATDPVTGNQFGAYHADNLPSVLSGKTALFKITPANVVTVDKSADTTDAQDSHNFYSLAIDGDGDLLLSGDMHGTPMQWQRLTGGSIDFTGWATPPIEAGATNETSVTYPLFIKLANGDVLLFYRDGASGDGKLVLKRWSKTANTLTLVATVVDGNVDGKSFYPHIPYWDETRGRLHCGGCWRDTTSINTNHDQLHFWLESSDNWVTCTAKKADGSAQTLPVTVANAAYALVLGTGNGLMNVGSITIGSDGNPRMWSYRDPGDGFTQLFVLRYTGSAWVNQWVPDNVQLQNGIPFSFIGVTSDTYRRISAPRALCDGVTDRTVILHLTETQGAGPQALICERADCTQWVYKALDGAINLGNSWFCAEDYYQWKTNKEIHTLVQRSQIKNYGTEPDIGPQTLKRLRFRPKSAAYTYTAPSALWNPDAYAGCITYVAPRVGGLKVKGGGAIADINAVTSVLDARDGTPFVDQASLNDTPHLVWDRYGTRRGGIQFVAANSDFMQGADAPTLASFNGTNIPMAVFVMCEFTSIANQRLWSLGDSAGSNLKYMEIGTDASGHVIWGRRVGGAAVKQYVGNTVLAINTKYLLACIFDGSTGYVLVNNVQQGTAIDMSFAATASTWTHATLGCRRRSTANDLYFDGYLGAMPHYTTIPSSPNISQICIDLAAEHGFSF